MSLIEFSASVNVNSNDIAGQLQGTVRLSDASAELALI